MANDGTIFILIGICVLVGWFGNEYRDSLPFKQIISVLVGCGIGGLIVAMVFFNALSKR